MRIALLTIHWANNYGASLQTYATVKALQNYGDVTLIDYRSYYPSKGMDLIRVGWEPRDVLRVAKDLCRIIPRYRVIKKFERFTKKMPLSRRVKTSKDFDALASQFDFFVCGSDQIWNPNIVGFKDRIDQRYFLDFVKGKNKLSYASSLGNYRYKGDHEQKVLELLSSFSSISVREDDAASYLSELTGRKVTSVLDPTLLLTPNDWFSMADREALKEKYILVYALIKDPELKRVVDYYRNQLGLKVIAIDQDPFINYRAEVHLKDVSPERFVGLISQAEFVITNSFHGVCFCVNFNKNFYVTTPMGSPNRIISLLKKVGLEGRFKMDFSSSHEIDFEGPNARLDSLRSSSMEYLNRNLSKSHQGASISL